MSGATKSLLLAGVALIVGAPAVHAQAGGASEPEDSGRIGEVVVTAQFREQHVQNTPLSITALNAEALEQRGQTNVVDIAGQVPNVTLKPQTSSWGPSLVATIRGVGQYNFNPALEPGVGLFVDDVYFPTLTGSMVDLVDVERIEVLRGPQGTLTGRNSIGGAIRIISREPDGENSGYVQGSVGSRDLTSVRGAADFALTDNIFVRISGASTTQDGYVERLDFGCVNPSSGIAPTRPVGVNCRLGPDLGALNSQAARGMVSFKLSDNAQFLLTGDVVHEAHPGPAEVLQSHARHPEWVCGQFCNYATYTQPDQRSAASPNAPTWFGYSNEPDTQFDSWGVSGRLSVDLTDTMTLTSITAYREYDSYFASDNDLGPTDLVRSAANAVWLSHWFASQELRLNGTIGRVEYTIGGYYSDQESVLQQLSDARPAIPLYITNDPIPAQNEAVFATVLVPVTDRLNLTGGIRYTHESKDYTFFRHSLAGVVTDPAFNGLKSSESDSVIDYRASIDYRWSPSFLTYFTYSTGFKGGGVNPLPTAVQVALPFAPETLDNYEAGFKSDLFDQHVRFNTSIFYDKYKDIHETALSCPQFGLAFCSLVANAGDATMKGVETELQARLGGFELDASYSYLDYEFTRVSPTVIGVTIGMVPPYVPETKYSIGAQYDFDLGAAGVLTPRFDQAYQSELFTNAANGPNNRIRPYSVANASLTWRNADRDLSVALRAENVFDKYYVLNNFDTSGFVGSVRTVIGPPRWFSLTVKKEF